MKPESARKSLSMLSSVTFENQLRDSNTYSSRIASPSNAAAGCRNVWTTVSGYARRRLQPLHEQLVLIVDQPAAVETGDPVFCTPLHRARWPTHRAKGPPGSSRLYRPTHTEWPCSSCVLSDPVEPGNSRLVVFVARKERSVRVGAAPAGKLRRDVGACDATRKDRLHGCTKIVGAFEKERSSFGKRERKPIVSHPVRRRPPPPAKNRD